MSQAPPIIRTERLHQLLRRLVDIYSPSGKEEQIVDYLHGYLKRHGLSTVRQVVDDRRHNLIVLPPGGEADLVLIGHLDTVTAYDLDDYGYKEQDDAVSGLGVADMKGGCAAMVEACLTLLDHGYASIPAALALVVGEEEDGDGADRLVEDYHFPWAVIGEPTALRPCFSHFAYLEIQLVTRGERMHASLATPDRNAIETMLRLLLKLTDYLAPQGSEVVYNIRDMESSRAGFAVPERCETWLDVHLPPTAPIGKFALELEEIVERESRNNTHLDAMLRFTTIEAGYDIPDKGPLAAVLKSVYERNGLPWQPEAFRSHSDANALWAAGVKPVIIGPGQLEEAHTPGESTSFREVCQAAQIYADTLAILAAESTRHGSESRESDEE